MSESLGLVSFCKQPAKSSAGADWHQWRSAALRQPANSPPHPPSKYYNFIPSKDKLYRQASNDILHSGLCAKCRRGSKELKLCVISPSALSALNRKKRSAQWVLFRASQLTWLVQRTALMNDTLSWKWRKNFLPCGDRESPKAREMQPINAALPPRAAGRSLRLEAAAPDWILCPTDRLCGISSAQVASEKAGKGCPVGNCKPLLSESTRHMMGLLGAGCNSLTLPELKQRTNTIPA